MTTHKKTWEAVLAEVEADMQHSGELLRANTDNVDRGAAITAFTGPVGPMSLGAKPSATAPELPPLDTMPPVPAELQERIRTLRANIIGLQTELAAEMTEWRTKYSGLTPTRQATNLAATVTRSQFVDRRM